MFISYKVNIKNYFLLLCALKKKCVLLYSFLYTSYTHIPIELFWEIKNVLRDQSQMKQVGLLVRQGWKIVLSPILNTESKSEHFSKTVEHD